MTESDVIDRSVPVAEWSDRTREDNERQVREAYERNDREWLKQQALVAPGEFLAAADAIGVQMPIDSRAWLLELAQSQDRQQFGVARCMTPSCYGFTATGVAGEVVGGPHWHVIDDGKDLGANPWPPRRLPSPSVIPHAAPAASTSPSAPPPPRPERQRCSDCGDLLPMWRHIPRCVRCNKVRLEAAREARERAARDALRDHPKPLPVFHCMVCRRSMTRDRLGRRLCAKCLAERSVEQVEAIEEPGLQRRHGDWPHLAVYRNRQGESVVHGRVLPHPRYGESQWDKFGDTAEWYDSD